LEIPEAGAAAVEAGTRRKKKMAVCAYRANGHYRIVAGNPPTQALRAMNGQCVSI
jgi:hypothetical protein